MTLNLVSGNNQPFTIIIYSIQSIIKINQIITKIEITLTSPE